MSSFQPRCTETQENRRGPTLEREVLFDLLSHRPLFAALTLGVVGYAAGHAALALAAGSVAASLSGAPLRSSFAALPSVAWLGNSLVVASYVGLAAALVKAASGAIAAGSERLLAARLSVRLRTSLLRELLRNGPAVPAPHALAQLSVRLREVESAVSEGVLTEVRAGVQLLPLGACLVVLSPSLALFAIIAVAPFAAAIATLRGRARRQSEVLHRELEALEIGLDELVSHSDLFRAYGAGERVLAAVESAGDRAGKSGARVDIARALLSGGNEVVAALVVVVAAASCVHFGLLGSAPLLLPFATIVFMAYRPLRDLGDARAWVARGEVALSAVRSKATLQSAEPPRKGTPFSAAPRLELVAAGAAERGPATTFSASPGEIVCLVGPTGSGKTTLFRVLLGLERARGAVRVDGVDITDAPSGPESRPLAWVPQEAPLVTGSVTENILLVGGDSEGASAALRLIGAERLAALSPDAVIGPGGQPLSGGERRQIALCRALVSGLPVLLLDEPTEGLDATAAESVCRAIANLRGRRTVLVSTHRDDVARVADRVVHVGSGEGSELREEPRVVFEEMADVRNAVADHGQPLDAKAEGEARVLLRIDAAMSEDVGVDHPRAENL
jgi:ABC-type multidrug transport system fused ATPase/permease subunit